MQMYLSYKISGCGSLNFQNEITQRDSNIEQLTQVYTQAPATTTPRDLGINLS